MPQLQNTSVYAMSTEEQAFPGAYTRLSVGCKHHMQMEAMARKVLSHKMQTEGHAQL